MERPAYRVRRARRQDRAALEPLVGRTLTPRERRGLRRLLADLRAEVYVAAGPDETLLGVVSITYHRSLVRGGGTALVEALRVDGDASQVREHLLHVAERRARERDCRRVAVWADADDALRTGLIARGYRGSELLVGALDVTDPCGVVTDRLRERQDG